MQSTLLAIHVSLAILTLGGATITALQTMRKKSAARVIHATWQTTGLAVISGFGLAFTTDASITSVCTSALALVAAVSVAHSSNHLVMRRHART